MRLLVVYNTCGISGRDNNPRLVDYYLHAISTIVAQKNVEIDVVVSACRNRKEVLDAIKSKFRDEVTINSILSTVPVNCSFNHTVDLCRGSEHDGVLYLDSGVCFSTHDDLAGMVRECTDTTGMLSCNVTTDAGIAVQDDFCKSHGLNQGRKLVVDRATKKRNVVSVGCSLNLHCQIFMRDFIDFYKRPFADIFKGYCSESVFSMQCAAIKRHWHFTDEVIVHHVANMDGQSSLEHPSQHIQSTGRPSYDHPFAIASYMDRFEDNYARSIGVCFEQCQNVVNPDMQCYDEDEFAIYPELGTYLQKNLYLTKEEFDYANIESEMI